MQYLLMHKERDKKIVLINKFILHNMMRKIY